MWADMMFENMGSEDMGRLNMICADSELFQECGELNVELEGYSEVIENALA